MTEINEVIVRVLQGRGTSQDEVRIALWRRQDVDHERHYRALAALWAVTSFAAPDLGHADHTPSLVELLRLARIREANPTTLVPGDANEIQPLRSDLARQQRGWLANRNVIGSLVAAGLAALGIGLGAYSLASDGVLSEGAIATGPGEMTTITLSDASSIRLAPNSRLRLYERRNLRMAWLEGRAFFGIHPNRDRPFVVYTEHGEARVVGTRFEVNAGDAGLTVLVVEGAVEVFAGGAGVSIAAGEMSQSQAGTQPVATAVADVYERMNWIGNAVVFQATPLRDAVREIEERFDVDVELVHPELQEILVTAAFTGESVPEVLRVVCEVINAVCEFDGSTVRIEASSP